MSMQLTTFNKTALGITLSLLKKFYQVKHLKVIFGREKFENSIVTYIDIYIFL